MLSEEKTAFFLGMIERALNEGNLCVVEYGLAGRDVKRLPADGPAETSWFEGRVQPLGFPVDGEDAWA